MGVAKKRSAGAVQQRRCGLIEAFDVIHMVKEERQLERPGDLSWFCCFACCSRHLEKKKVIPEMPVEIDSSAS